MEQEPTQPFQGEAPISPSTVGQTLEPKKSKAIPIKIIIGVVVLIVLGVTVALASQAWDPLWNPFRPEPDEVLEMMSEKEMKSGHIEGKVEVGIRGVEIDSITEDKIGPSKVSVLIDFKQDFDNTNPDVLKNAIALISEIEFNGTKFEIAGESKNIGKEGYLKLTTIPFPLQFPLALLGIDSKEIENQWIKIDEESLMEILKEFGLEQILPSEEEIKKAEEKEKALIEKLEKLAEGKKLFFVKEELKDEKIDKKSVYHYIVALDNKEIAEISPEFLKIAIESFFSEIVESLLADQEFLEEDKAKLKEKTPEEIMAKISEKSGEIEKVVNDFLEKVGEITAETWIGKRDKFLYKVLFEKEIDFSKFEPTTKGKLNVKIDLNSSNFNQPITIEAPTEFKTLEEIIGGGLMEFFKPQGLQTTPPALTPEEEKELEELLKQLQEQR